MTLTLRDYQEQAVNAIYGALRERDDNPVAVLPTAAGKTPCIARICLDATTTWNGRVLVLAHVKELLEQAVKHLQKADPALEKTVGVYSAGLGKREVGFPITVAGIQSVYKRACELGPLDLIICDEVHLVPTEGDGMYRTFLADAKLVNPRVRLVGFTATPYRMKTGMICAPENLFNHVCHETGVKELIARGFLCDLKSRAGSTAVDTSGLHVVAGEFANDEVEALMDTKALVESAVKDILRAVAVEKRRSILVFAAGVEHGGHVAKQLREQTGCEVGEVYGDTPAEERSSLIAKFKSGELQFLVNVNVLSIGFDAPNVDCVCLLRPTMSPGLYYQQVGRSFRIHPDKKYALVLDFAGNVLRHGPVDLLRPEAKRQGSGDAPSKVCPGYKCSCGAIVDGYAARCSSCDAVIPLGVDRCNAIVHAAYRTCPECGYTFPAPGKKHGTRHGTESVLSEASTPVEHEVERTSYSVHTKRDGDPLAPKTMRVTYSIKGNLSTLISEWVCVEHGGFARNKAESWWRSRSDHPCPKTAVEAVEQANEGGLAEASKITVVKEGKFDRVVSWDLGPKPAWRPWLEDQADREAERASLVKELSEENQKNAGGAEVPF